MFNLDDITDEHNKKHNKKCPYTPNHPYKMLITICSGSGKTKGLFDLIKKTNSNNLIDRVYLYAKRLNEPKYQFLLKNVNM